MTLSHSTETPAPGEPAAAPPAAVAGAPTVAVYDDQALARAGLTALLRSNSIRVVSASPVDLEHVLASRLGCAPDVILIATAGRGAELAQRLGRERRAPVLLMLEGPLGGDMALALAAAGASGAICRECPPEQLVRAIHAIGAGATFFECHHRPPSPERAPSPLSERERHVAAELARGAGTEEIAAALCISPHTARTHVRNLKRKLGARTSAQAVALAITMRLAAHPAPPGPPAPPPRSRA